MFWKKKEGKLAAKNLLSKEKKFYRIISAIKRIKIQGANNIAREGVKAFLIFPDKFHAKLIVSSRPTEPLLQNFIDILLKSENPAKTAQKLFSYLKLSQKKINRAGLALIKNGMKIFSHCHSSSVIELLKHAKKMKKNFVVYTVEVEPLLQGRRTAKELAQFGISVVVMPDLSAEQFLKKCDLFLFGADAYTKSYIYNKIGTNTLVKLASLYKIPSYSLGVSLKYTKTISLEQRSGKEVWDEREPNIVVKNLAFDKTQGKEVTGVLSEMGILPYKQFIKSAKNHIKSLRKTLA
jgi:translation initiation factor 2B subunit (eIF-2B alpha/beta/delta family)